MMGSYRDLLESDLCLVVGRPRAKVPLPHPETGGWWPIHTDEELAEALGTVPECNMMVDCVASDLVQVDPDSTEALSWGKEHGLTSAGAWLIRSARGVKALYCAPDCELPPAWNDKEHHTVDIGNRLCLAPPSVHPSGLRLTWAQGHSPTDIPRGELAPLPRGLLKAWQELKAPKPKLVRHEFSAPGWLGIVYDAIVSHIEAQGGRLRHSSNGGMVGRCPLHHDQNPSFSIHPERGWKCFSGCGEGRLTGLAARLGVRVQIGGSK